MIHAVLIVAGMIGQADPGPASKPNDAAAAREATPPAEVLAEYNARREKAQDTAAAQSMLAQWCEQHGLPAEAMVHYAAVVRLDPSRDAAWRKLGFKKVGGRWLNDEQIAEEAEQKKADKVWAPRLKKIHKDIHGGKKQAEAEQAAQEIIDPKAIPSVYQEFGGSAMDQLIAVQILGQIDAPLASKVIAVLAIYGKSPEVRRRATETLRQRDPDDYLPVFVGLLADPIKYEVRPVGGPGSPGVLVVEGKKFNVRRVYAPPAPNLVPMPGDIISYDTMGMPIFTRPLMSTSSKPIPGSKLGESTQVGIQFSGADVLNAASMAAAGAQAQLQGDVAAIDGLNKAAREFNGLVMMAARDASGKDLGDKPEDWREAVETKQPKPYAKAPGKLPRKPTYDELVPLAYVPSIGGQLGFVNKIAPFTPG
jgi:hypothetical protein